MAAIVTRPARTGAPPTSCAGGSAEAGTAPGRPRPSIRSAREASSARCPSRWSPWARRLGQLPRFLDFAPAHARLVEEIAAATAGHAAVVGSGRVGRTRLLSLEEKAALAARAHIRHRFTTYEDELDNLPFEAWDEDDLYREIKGATHEAVDDFLDEHREQ